MRIKEDIKSTVIKSVSYDKGVISVWLKSGGEPLRFDGSEKLYEEFISSVSPGKFYHERVKGLARVLPK